MYPYCPLKATLSTSVLDSSIICHIYYIPTIDIYLKRWNWAIGGYKAFAQNDGIARWFGQ